MVNQEQSHLSKGVIGSLLIHALILLILFYFIISPPNPPLGELGGSGIELNYGLDAEGYGDVQTMNNASDSPLKEEAAPSDDKPVEEPTPESTPEPEPVANTSDLLKSDDPEDVKLEETKKEKIITPKKQPEKPVEKPTEAKTEVAKQVVKPSVTTTETSNGKTGTAQVNGGNNNGDRPGKVGDQGNPNGSLDAKALYGNLGTGGDGTGGSGGNRLDMSGWKPLFQIKKKDATSENGKIVFLIKVDEQGELVSIAPIEKTVSPAVVEFYKKQIEENWAVERARENTNPPPISTGKYTVFVKSK